MKMISLITVLALAFLYPAFSQPEDIPDSGIRESAQEIQLLNLINSLYLTKDQIQFILIRVEELERIKQTGSEEAAGHKEILERIKEDLKKDNYVNDINREEFQRVKEYAEELRKQYKEKQREYAQEIKEKLTLVQQKIIEDYRPCIIPPKGPARIGQADDGGRFHEHIERIYNMPEDIYSQRKDELAKKVIERAKDHMLKEIDISELDEKYLTREILDFYEKVRGMDEIEFEVKKEDLSKEFKEMLPHHNVQTDLITKIQRLLLNPSIIPPLEERLEKT